MSTIPIGTTDHPFISNFTTNTEEQLCQLNSLFGEARYTLEVYTSVRDRLKNVSKALGNRVSKGGQLNKLYKTQLHLKILEMQICNYNTTPGFANATMDNVLQYLASYEKELNVYPSSSSQLP